ncbi:hypothetical protein A9Q84_12005 [Halobacteriovorax marinus]|uniref:Response regulatory domain-containing protein n=1 Tax=Halobacteriovorax marinus TaxID=97084 RepID=A0A1Y5FDK6_9BACT|nr:hypothetical protein A9Q84_12005 [Halobacteriovorax marinus]
MKHILIVDDEESIQFLFSRMFKKETKNEKFKLYYANSGREAIQVIKTQEKLDLVITDINMPEMDGFELLKYIIENHETIPVFMASAYTDNERKILAKEMGASRYISKPIDFAKLKELLDGFFS